MNYKKYIGYMVYVNGEYTEQGNGEPDPYKHISWYNIAREKISKIKPEWTIKNWYREKDETFPRYRVLALGKALQDLSYSDIFIGVQEKDEIFLDETFMKLYGYAKSMGIPIYILNDDKLECVEEGKHAED